MTTQGKTKKMPLIQTPIEKKLLRDLFATAPKVTKVLSEVLRISTHFTPGETDLIIRLNTLFSEVSRRPVVKEIEK
jgi:hypothetical protein